jgi:hypothetical protein
MKSANSTIYVGFDPGSSSGVLSFLMPDGTVHLHGVPTLPEKRQVGRYSFYQHDSVALNKIISQRIGKQRAIALVEQVHIDSRDTSKMASAEGLIRSHEAVKTLLLVHGVGVINAVPAQWRSVLGIVGSDEEQAIALAIKLYPSIRDQIFYKSRNGKYARNHNRAEAVLMMHAAKLLTERSLELSDDSAA